MHAHDRYRGARRSSHQGVAALGPAERERIVVHWNDTRTVYEGPACLHEIFEAQVIRTPQRTAVVFEGESLTYDELNVRANRIAHRLRRHGVGPEVPVAICMERSIEMVVGLYGILKAGGAYVPLDPGHPRQRLEQMLHESGTPVVLVQDRLAGVVPDGTWEAIRVDPDFKVVEGEQSGNPASGARADNLAYVIYTSGSTGAPKGAMVTHRAIRNRLLWMQEAFGLTERDRVLQKTPYTFDVSVWEFFWPLLTGATLVVTRPEGHRDPAYLLGMIDEHQITTVHFVPSMLRAFVGSVEAQGPRSLERVICSGEALSPDLPAQFRAHFDAELHNLYGPTEAAVDVTAWRCGLGDDETTVPIGRPIANTRIYLLDAALDPVPIGEPGELYIGGVQVARGYLGRPELTAERFVPDPFGDQPGARLYRTGDLARYRSDGNIEFIGRVDHQVKLRGFRIELGEIEIALTAHPEVEHAVAVVCDERLVAYFVANRDRVAEADLERLLRDRLPEYMVPTTYVALDAIPLTPNGKVDRRALPAPDRRRPDLDATYARARTPVEERLVEIWEETLRLEGIGVDDPFDRLGGSSLEAASVISALRETFGVELPFRIFFDDVTVAQLAERIEAAPRGDGAGVVTIPRAARPELLPLTPSQERVWFVQQLDPEGREYLYPSAIRLTGALDVPALEQSLSEIIRRHEIFRTSFEEVDGRPVQRIHPPFAVELPVIDVSGDSAPEREEALWQRLHADYREIFDLTRLPLVRWRLYRLNETEHVLSHNEHHIVHDGWSFHVFLHEMIELYRAFSLGEPSPLPELPIQFADYAIWERQWVEGDEAAAQLEYWREKLAEPPPLLELPFDHPRPATQTFVGSNRHLELPGDLCTRLRHLGRRDGASFYMTVMATLLTLLHRYSGQRDISVGVPTANRRFRETEGQLGMIINNFVLRTELSGDLTFRELLRRVRDGAREGMAHQELPFDRVVEAVQPERAASHNPLFQVMVGINDVPLDVAPLPELSVRVHPALSNGSAKFDMAMVLFPHAAQWVGREPQADPDGVTVMIEYNTDLFEHDTIARLSEHFRALLEAVIDAPETRLSALPMLSGGELRLMLEDWNDTATAYARDATVAELFTRQSRRAPDAIAVRYDDEELTYAELDARANRLAHHLRGLGVGPATLVGLCLEPSAAMVVGMLAILKAGGAYVPLDPGYPQDRLRFMLEDTAAPVVVTASDLAPQLGDAGAQLVCVDEAAGAIATLPATPPDGDASARDVAYVIYTSGSTGRPKGVCVPHEAITRLVVNAEYVDLGPNDTIAQASNANFDAATFEIWGALLNGACLAGVRKDELLSARILAGVLREREVTVLFVTTALFNQLVREMPDVFAPLRYVLFGGQAVDPRWVRDMRRAGAPEHLLHVYGPTESTTYATWHEVKEVAENATTIPIGRGIANTRTYVLDERLQPVPVGAKGELYLGGPGVATGYLNRPALTAERFGPDPFGPESGGRLYRTGDVVRWNAAGGIEFLGRNDHQVKLRGFRIELGEIEAALSAHEGVDEAVVLCREDTPGGKQLVAYVARSAQNDVAPEALRAWLGEHLPSYMVPSTFVVLDEMPLNPNGKIDRAALPRPSGERQTDEAFVAPRSATERQIAAVWCEVLGVDRVGVRDNFFDLGGHSLRLLQVRAKLAERLGRAVRATDLFQHPTVETLAARLADETAPERSLQRAASARVGARRRTDDDAIAVVAMAGRFPGAPDLKSFWRNLRAGVESIRVFTDEELLAAGVPEAQLGDPNYVKARAVLDGADEFDAWFFGYTPREAALIDPQQRVFLECAWEALERAGCDPARYAGLIGVWAGVDINRYFENLRTHPEILAEAGAHQVLLASDKDFLPTRVSYKLNLKGPSVNVQTACSTSLVAVHEACEALREHRCDMALAGGVSVAVPLASGYVHQPGGILSPDGHCRTFDAKAKGTVGASGVGIVVLKRLADAERDGDRIRAVVRGTATNNDGARKVGFTAPSVEGQAEVIALAQAAAGVDAASISYVEAHGTGTALGDPIEVAALQRVFGEATDRRHFCALGSLKSNIGHLSSAAGVGGLIKTVLSLEHGELPPSLHYERSNPEIDFEHSAFYVNTTLKPWDRASETPRRAGVSSFGLGGTNAHAVLEEAPASAASEPASRPEQLLVLSAKTPSALERVAANLAAHMEEHPEMPLADVAWTQQTGRAELEHRCAVVASNSADACAALRGDGANTSWLGHAAAGRHEVAFLFPGQGAQYVGMGRELYEREGVFRETVDRCCDLLADELGTDLREVLYPAAGANDETSARLKKTSWAQPALFVIEYALAEQWRSWGIEPSACAGHSIGELVAACVSGVLRLEDALPLVALRGRLMERMPAGVMTAVPLSAEALEAKLAPEPGLWLSAVNGPSLCVVSGTEERVAAWEAERAREGIECRRLHTSHAFHSGLMDDAVAPFVEAFRDVEIGEPRIPYVSNVTGTWITGADVRDPSYWGRHIRHAVRFGEGLDRILSEERRVLLEVGPGQVLGALARQQSRWSASRIAVPSLRGPVEETSDVTFLLGALGRLWTGGVSVPWAKVHGGERRQRVELPTYPFERQRFWVDRQETPAGGHPRSLAKLPSIDDWFSVPLWRQTAPLTGQRDAGRWLVIGTDTPEREAVLRSLRFAGAEIETVPANAIAEVPDWPARIALITDDAAAPALLALARALDAPANDAGREVVVVCSGLHAVTDDESRDPGAAAVDAMARVVAQELPHVRCRTVDVREDVPDQALAAELLAEDAPPTVALRAGRRWTLAYEPVPLTGTASERVAEDGKVYLITGGLGRVGMALAASLAGDAQVTLVLSSRRTVPADDETDTRGQRIRALETLGATVVVMRADVSDPAQVARLVEEIDARCGRLDGVIHAAGVTGGASLRAVATLDDAACRAQLGPKRDALAILDEALRGRSLDFRVATSSISTVLGGLELGAYAAANAAMEAAAAASPDGWRTIATDGWAFDQHAAADGPRSDALRLAMTPEEGVEATRRAITAGASFPHLIVSTADVESRIERWVASRADETARRAAIERHARPALSTAYAAPETETQQALVEFWQEVLGIERVGIDDDFLELGGHSLLATQAVSRMRERFAIALPVQVVFQHPTVARLAEEIERIQWAAGNAPARRTPNGETEGGTL